MKNAKRTLLSYGVLSAIASWSATAWAANEPSPFASTPLHLQNSVTNTSYDGVKPNVLIQFDDSTSMNRDINDKKTGNIYNQKITIAQSALLKLLDNPKYRDNLYWGFITLNWSSLTGSFFPDHNDISLATNPDNYPLNLDASKVKTQVAGLFGAGNTPSTYRYVDSTYLIRRHLNSPNPTDLPKTKAELLAKADPNAYKYRCQKNYIIVFSDGDANDPPVTYADNNGVIKDVSNSYLGKRKTLVQERPNFMSQPDWETYSAYPGAPYANTGHQYPIGEPSEAAQTFGYLARYVNSHDLKQGGTDAAGKSWDDPAFKDQTISTYTIGFGNGLSAEGKNYLDAGATGNKFKALNASNEKELDDAFATIFDKITGENKINSVEAYATVSPGPAGGITTGVPNIAAVVGLDTGSWSSEIRFFKLDLSAHADGSANPKVDTSSYVQPDFSRRKLMINTGNRVYMSDNVSGVDNQTFSLTSSHNPYEWFSSMIPWLARSKSNSQINVAGNELIYRDRLPTASGFDTRSMGDILDSNVLAIGDDVNGRQEFMVTAANDGLVYLFKSSANIKTPYSLALNYAPIGMQRQNNTDYLAHYFKDIVNPKYGKDTSHPHIYMLNGGITVRRTDDAKDKGRQMFMVGNMGQGARGAYALNIGGEHRTNKTPIGISAPEKDWLQSVPLFETPKGNNNDLGYTVGLPQIGRFVKNRNGAGRPDPKADAVQYGAFIANGFNSPNSKESALYIYEALGQDVGLNGTRSVDRPGTLIKKLVAANNTGGLATPTLVDADFDGIIDIAYAGDKAGNMYRFDFRGRSPSDWKVTQIFEGNITKPITAAPAIFRCNTDDKCSNNKGSSDTNNYQYVVVFGTGRDMYQSDLNDTNTQSVYGLFDSLDRDLTVNQTQLLEQTITESQHANKAGVDKNVRLLSDVEIPEDNFYGWFFNLPATGERVVTKPEMILRTAIFTTRSYSSSQVNSSSQGGTGQVYDPCIASSESFNTQGHSWLMAVDVKNGGAVDAQNYEGEAYIDFFAEGTHHKKTHSQLQQGEKQEVPGIIYSGYDMGAGLTAFSTISTTKKGLARTVDGDSGDSGTDLTVKDSAGTPPDNLCFDDNGYVLPVTTSGIQEPYFYNGKICAPTPSKGSLRRISIREIAL